MNGVVYFKVGYYLRLYYDLLCNFFIEGIFFLDFKCFKWFYRIILFLENNSFFGGRFMDIFWNCILRKDW